MKKKLLITGSGGFIMSNFIRKSLYEGFPYSVVSIDNVEKTSILNNIYSNKNHQFYIGDVTNSHFLNIIFELEKPDIVLHASAETPNSQSLNNSTKFINSNILSTQNIIDLCIKYKIDRLIYTSTDKIYGSLPDGSASEEDMPKPENLYAASKLSAEMLIEAAHRNYGLSYNIMRSSNIYGPRQTANKLIPLIIKNILNNQITKIVNQGKQLREWTHVQDNCSAILDILNKGEYNKIYNISSNHEFSTIEIFNEVANLMEKGHNLISFEDDNSYHALRYSSNSNKIRNIGWKPSFKFRDGLKHTVSWYLNNQWFLKL